MNIKEVTIQSIEEDWDEAMYKVIGFPSPHSIIRYQIIDTVNELLSMEFPIDLEDVENVDEILLEQTVQDEICPNLHFWRIEENQAIFLYYPVLHFPQEIYSKPIICDGMQNIEDTLLKLEKKMAKRHHLPLDVIEEMQWSGKIPLKTLERLTSGYLGIEEIMEEVQQGRLSKSTKQRIASGGGLSKMLEAPLKKAEEIQRDFYDTFKALYNDVLAQYEEVTTL